MRPKIAPIFVLKIYSSLTRSWTEPCQSPSQDSVLKSIATAINPLLKPLEFLIRNAGKENEPHSICCAGTEI
jgi:hypothetical protein